MKKSFLVFGFLILGLSVQSQMLVDSVKINIARDFRTNFFGKRFDLCMKNLDWEVAGKVNSAALESICNNLQTQSGNYKECIDTYMEKSGDYHVVFQTCHFEKTNLDLKLTINNENKIAGIFFSQPKSKELYKLPDYVTISEVLETELVIKSGAYNLPATLTYPKNGSKFPGVVLVHGSGPNDKDESIGPNKIFKDIAYGLASKGVAVLRYEKRTHAYAKQLMDKADSITLKEETIDDAVAAVAELKKIVAVDANKVFVLGHSLGAMCAPAIAQQSAVAGIIMMAGNARPLEDLIVEQMQYLSSLNPSDNNSKAQIDQIKTQALNVKSLDDNSDIDSWQLPLSLPKNYWLYLNRYHQTQVAQTLSIPIFIMQGARDYQVTVTDYNQWQKALSGKPSVQFKLYDKLNHLFMEGTGKSTPKEYDKASNIPLYVIIDISTFIKK